MKKTFTVLSLVATIVLEISVLIAASFLTFLWEPMCSLFTTESIAGPIFSVSLILRAIVLTVVSLLLLFTAKSKKSIAIEIVSIVIIVIGLPVLTEIISNIQQTFVNTYGFMYVQRYAVTNTILNIPTLLMSVASAICIVVSGMRIAYKINLGKQRSQITNVPMQ